MPGTATVSRSLPFVCSSCALELARSALLRPLGLPHSTIKTRTLWRHASNLVSATAINPPLNVPNSLKSLHEALQSLGVKATNYVDLPRLRLAVKGVQTLEPTLRVAVLGLGNQDVARRLARLLFADPLAEKSEWEEKLEQGDDGRAILLRYGDDSSPSAVDTPLLRTLSVPSSILHRNRLEILVSRLNVDYDYDSMRHGVSSEESVNSILAPRLEFPTAAGGRYSNVQWPVHRAIVVGSGTKSLINYGRYTSLQRAKDVLSGMIKLAISLPVPTESDTSGTKDEVPIIDINLADRAMARIRSSVQNSLLYEHEWFRSNLPSILVWLSPASKSLDAQPVLHPALVSLIISLLAIANNRLLDATASLTCADAAQTLYSSLKSSLLSSLTSWSERAHTELRDSLDLAFSSKHWRKLAWWKLPWRTDDVALVAHELLERRFLVDAEMELIFLIGRIAEVHRLLVLKRGEGASNIVAGKTIPEPTPYVPLPPRQPVVDSRDGSPAIATTLHAFEVAKKDYREAAFSTGQVVLNGRVVWPLDIKAARLHFSERETGPLQATAQRVVVDAVGGIGISVAVAGLFAWIAWPTWGAYHVGALVAAGAALVVRRWRRRWEGERKEWEMRVREAGRVVLRDVESKVTGILENLERVGGGEEEMEERAEAAEAIERVRIELEKLVKSS